MIGQPSTQLLDKTEQSIVAKVNPKYKKVLSQAISAALKITYDPQNKELLNGFLNRGSNPAQDAGQAGFGMITMAQKRSGNKFPIQVLVPGAVILALEFLDLLGKSGKCQVTTDLIDETVQIAGSTVLQGLKVSPQQMQQMVAQAKQKQVQPQAQQQGLMSAPGPQ